MFSCSRSWAQENSGLTCLGFHEVQVWDTCLACEPLIPHAIPGTTRAHIFPISLLSTARCGPQQCLFFMLGVSSSQPQGNW